MEASQLLPYFKSFHIVGVIAWFAGLFYLVRIFVYHAEALQKSEIEQKILIPQYVLMEGRVFKIICQPALLIALIFGFGMTVLMPAYFSMAWLQWKLFFVVLMIAYHEACNAQRKKLARGDAGMSSFQYRLFNEFPTLMLIIIVLLAVVKDGLNLPYTILGIIVFGLLLYVFTKAYKNKREKDSKKTT